MAGKGTRLRPQTLTTPKPLINIAGRTIIQRIVDLVSKSNITIENIGFVIEQKNKNIEELLYSVSKKNKIKAHVFYQKEPNGTAHAIYCAKELLKGPTLVVFADTLFDASLKFPKDIDACILVKEVPNPSSYGVVQLNEIEQVVGFIEKPKNNISNLAIIGVYYFKEGQDLRSQISYILTNDIKEKGEFQITTALSQLKNKGKVFKTKKINHWFDFGNPKNLLESHAEILKREQLNTPGIKNSKIIPPCYISKTATIINSTIGPNVSIGSGTVVENSYLENTIIQSQSKILGAKLHSSIIGSHVEYKEGFKSVNIGDYNVLK